MRKVMNMRVLVLSGLLVLALATGALAQTGYQYQRSGLEFAPTSPAQVGDTVRGLLKLTNGLTALGDVYVQDIYYDDLFAYWIGSYNGGQYFYDKYSGFWKPGPVTYRHSRLNFQGNWIEGFTRSFGNLLDYDNFIGIDGALYRRINIERNRRRDTASRRKVIYTYFVNMDTGERSDSAARAYRVIGDMGVAQEVVDRQIKQQQEALDRILEANPAFPNWQVEAFTPPAEVITPDQGVVENSVTLLEAIEGEIGPLEISQPVTDAQAAKEVQAAQ